MKETIVMGDYDGNPWRSDKVERTKIVPLRKISNWLSFIAANHLGKQIELDESGSYGLRYKYHGYMWTYLNKPYEKWGTFYRLDADKLEKWFASHNES